MTRSRPVGLLGAAVALPLVALAAAGFCNTFVRHTRPSGWDADEATPQTTV
jgi:hypothetical protein